MLYSAGDCPVCSYGGDILFVRDFASGRLFFLCPSGGCAWLNPPSPFVVDTVDPLEIFAPQGIGLPSRAEIVAMGLEKDIKKEVDDDQWLVSLQNFLRCDD